MLFASLALLPTLMGPAPLTGGATAPTAPTAPIAPITPIAAAQSQVSRAVDSACRWLATHQDEDGRWDCDGFMKHDGAPAGRAAEEDDDAFWDRALGGGKGTVNDAFGDTASEAGAGDPPHDVGVTGLALLALMADGHTPMAGAHKLSVARGFDWLVAQQDKDSGRLGEANSIASHYDHAIGTLALAKAYAATRSEAHGVALQRAVGYIARARNPYGAWRYDYPPNGDNDTSITTWMVLALRAAEDAGATVDRAAYEGALTWFDEVTDPDNGRVGYDARGSGSSRVPGKNDGFPSDRSEPLTAGALLCRLRLGADARKEPVVVQQVKLILEAGRRTRKGALQDAIWHYWGTAAMNEIQSRPWKEWSEQVAEVIVQTQQTDGVEAGSWDPTNVWGYSMGRVGSTALAASTLAMFERGDQPAGSAARVDATEDPPKTARVERGDPSESIQEVVERGVQWIAAHQEPQGFWQADRAIEGEAQDERAGDPIHNIGVTGLAVLAFLGDGQTPQSGPHRANVARAIQWLLDEQDPETGLVGDEIGHTFLYNHGIATLALTEAYMLTRSPNLKAPAQKAVNFVLRARNPYGAWRYEVPPNGDNDTSVTSWMVQALRSAKDAGLQIDPQAFEGAAGWLDEVTDPATGRVGYWAKGSPSARVPGINDDFPLEGAEAMTAAGLYSRFLIGQTPATHGIMDKHADLLFGTLPRWNPQTFGVDLYAIYYGTRAMYQMGGEEWEAWAAALETLLVESQRGDGDADGSWDPDGPWGYAGGRVYSTALMTLSAQVVGRYKALVAPGEGGR